MTYKVRYLENDTAEVVFINGENIEILPLGNVKGMSADKVDELAIQVCEQNKIALPKVNKDFYEDVKADIDLARTEMRKVMKLMASKDLSVNDKNELVEVCKTEIASAMALGKLLKQRVELEWAYGNNKKH